MTTLIEGMRQELIRRNYAATTIQSYLKAAEHFQKHVSSPLEAIGPDDIRGYHAYLLGERKLAVNTVVLNVCALRFLYIKVLKRGSKGIHVDTGVAPGAHSRAGGSTWTTHFRLPPNDGHQRSSPTYGAGS